MSSRVAMRCHQDCEQWSSTESSSEEEIPLEPRGYEMLGEDLLPQLLFFSPKNNGSVEKIAMFVEGDYDYWRNPLFLTSMIMEGSVFLKIEGCCFRSWLIGC